MLSASPDLFDPEDPLNFLYPIEEQLVLQDNGLTFPEDLSAYEVVPALKREAFMPVLIRALFAARGQIIMSEFFAELIGRGAMTLESLDNLITILEDESQGLSNVEMELFIDVYKRLRKAHTPLPSITGRNITNALIGFTSHSKKPRQQMLADWRYEVEATVEGCGGMGTDFMDRFNGSSLAMIRQLPLPETNSERR